MQILEIIARIVIYTLLGVLCLLCAAIVGWIGAICGRVIGLVSSSLLCLAIPRAAALGPLISVSGGLMGGAYALLFILRVWMAEALRSDDPLIRGHAQRLDALLHATRRPR